MKRLLTSPCLMDISMKYSLLSLDIVVLLSMGWLANYEGGKQKQNHNQINKDTIVSDHCGTYLNFNFQPISFCESWTFDKAIEIIYGLNWISWN